MHNKQQFSYDISIKSKEKKLRRAYWKKILKNKEKKVLKCMKKLNFNIKIVLNYLSKFINKDIFCYYECFVFKAIKKISVFILMIEQPE